MFSDKKEELSILIYISTSKISASFVLFSGGKSPRVVHNIISTFSSGLKLDDFFLSQTISSLLDTTLTNLIKDGSSIPFLKGYLKNIKSIFVTFSNPWFTLKIKDLHLEQKISFVITLDFISNILHVEEKKIEKELLTSTVPSEGNSKQELSIIENTFTHMKINGYSISNNIGKKTDNFDISLYSSLVPNNIVKDLLSIIHKHTHLNNDKIHLNSFPLVFFYALKNMFSATNSFLFMNVEGETTSLTLVHDGGINRSISFPSAKNFIMRKIAKNLDVSPEIAESMLHMYNSEKLDKEFMQKISETLEDVEKEWSIYLEDSLSDFAKNISLPSVIYMMAESDVAILYKNFLKKAKSQSVITFRKNLNIVQIDNNSFSNFCTFDLNAKNDLHIASIAVFHNKVGLGNF